MGDGGCKNRSIYGSTIDKRKELGQPADQKALLTWDVFRGQTTDHVAQILDSLNIKVVKVPANMTHFFQPLDLTVNGSAKKIYEKKVCNLVC